MLRRNFLKLLSCVPCLIAMKWQTLTGTWEIERECLIEFELRYYSLKIAACSDGKLRAWFGGMPMNTIKPRRNTQMTCFAGKFHGQAAEILVDYIPCEGTFLIDYFYICSDPDNLLDPREPEATHEFFEDFNDRIVAPVFYRIVS
jgi:hypothetical protein